MKSYTNTFVKGLNSDVDKSKVSGENFIEAHNLNLIGDGKFYSLQNLAGTEEIGTIKAAFSGEVIGIYNSRYKIDGVSDIECLTVFTVESGGNFTIWCYNLQTPGVTKLYEESYTWSSSLPVIDAVNYPDNGVDILYFTDGANELRRLRCEFTNPVTLLNAKQLSLQRRAPLCNLTHTPTIGGTLPTGSYQYSFRLYNNVTRNYSKWSVPSIPVVIANQGTFLEGYYNVKSTSAVQLDLAVVSSELSYWTHFQYSVIENNTNVRPVVASLLPIQPLSGGSVGGGFTTFTYNHTNSFNIGTINISDITVDLAAIKNARTIATKNNRLFVGNVEYIYNDYDRTPTVTGSVTTQAVSQTPTNDQLTKYKGYFRDEVYRFYAVYWDDKYNFSDPKRIDMSAITGNQIANGDMRFPARGGSYAVMDNSNNYLNLGLSLTINNHPSWARGVAIFRAKRKKRKLFQTPVIPMVEVQGVSTLGSYPTIATESPYNSGTGSATRHDYPSATPMDQAGTLVPKNLFYPLARHIERRKYSTSSTSYGAVDAGARNMKGETAWTTDDLYYGPAKQYSAIFEPGYSYHQDSFYTPTTSDKINVIDFAFTRLNYSRFDTTGFNIGSTSETSVHGTFYSNRSQDYMLSYGTSYTYPGTTTGNVTGYKPLDNYGDGTSLGGSYIGMYNNLVTNGISWGIKPNNQRVGILQSTLGYGDYTYDFNNIKAGAIPGAFIQHTITNLRSPIAPANANGLSNDTVVDLGGFVADNTYTGVVAIADIESAYGDDRYGTADTIQDLVYTGASYTFNDSELATVVSSGNVPKSFTVFGGDCHVSLHHFKINDSHYGISNIEKTLNISSPSPDTVQNLVQKWQRFFWTKPSLDGDAVTLPVVYKNMSQVLAVVLESEFHGQLVASQPYTDQVGGSQVRTTTKEQNCRVAFNNLMSLGYTIDSDQKTLIPYNPNQTITTKYKARVNFSNQKVYNTDIQGFDMFPVGNTVDFDPQQGYLSKLALVTNYMYALQEKGIAMLPVDAKILSSTDAQLISIKSGSVDIPAYISRQTGCQHTKSVQIATDKIFFVDNHNQDCGKLTDNLEIVSEKGAIRRFNTLFDSQLASNAVFSVYDNNRSQYWVFTKGGFCIVWDDRLGVWQDQLDFSASNCLYGGVFTNNDLYLLGRDGSSNLKVYRMYTGSPNSFFGATVTPYVTVTVNPDYTQPKTFDNIAAYSTDPLSSVDAIAETETGATGGQILGMNFAVNRREGFYLIPVLRDANGARLRGTRTDLTIYWPTDKQVALSQVVTKYRISNRQIDGE